MYHLNKEVAFIEPIFLGLDVHVGTGLALLNLKPLSMLKPVGLKHRKFSTNREKKDR